MNSAESLQITMPRGDTASFEEMQAYGDTLQRFIVEQEAALVHEQDNRRHDEIVDYLELLASGYNQQLRLFKEVEKRRQRVLMVALLQFGSR